MNTESINQWYAAAEEWEKQFVDTYGQRFNIIINPSKTIDKYAPDLYCLKKYKSADLKPMFTPFYKSMHLFNVLPENAWTFNVSDFFEYIIKYDNDFPIFIWVKFPKSEQYGIIIPQKETIYYTTIGKIKAYAELNKMVHKYGKRVGDEKNEQQSIVLDLSSNIFTVIFNQQ